MQRLLPLFRRSSIVLLLFYLTSCATVSRHHFTEPSQDWQAKSGQLLFHGAKTTIIGEVLIRFSQSGDFELTFSKGPGVTLMTVRQDANFGRVSGPLARGSWSGAPGNAPVRLRGWFELRELLMRSRNQSTVRHVAGTDTFIFRF